VYYVVDIGRRLARPNSPHLLETEGDCGDTSRRTLPPTRSAVATPRGRAASKDARWQVLHARQPARPVTVLCGLGVVVRRVPRLDGSVIVDNPQNVRAQRISEAPNHSVDAPVEESNECRA
jgi:hypothetical protein